MASCIQFGSLYPLVSRCPCLTSSGHSKITCQQRLNDQFIIKRIVPEDLSAVSSVGDQSRTWRMDTHDRLRMLLLLLLPVSFWAILSLTTS